MNARRLLLVTLAVLAAAWLAACGSDSSTSTERSATSSPATHPTPAAKEGAEKPPAHHDSGGGSAQFRTKGGDNSIEELGDEASSSEFEQAATTLHTFLDARAAHDWRAACESLAPLVAQQLEQQFGGGSGGKSQGCAQVLAALSASFTPQALREAAVADADALRAEGERGFLLFEGAHGTAYFMPMSREDGSWKVAAVAASVLP